MKRKTQTFNSIGVITQNDIDQFAGKDQIYNMMKNNLSDDIKTRGEQRNRLKEYLIINTAKKKLDIAEGFRIMWTYKAKGLEVPEYVIHVGGTSEN